MRLLIGLLISTSLSAQLPTQGLVVQYDLPSLASGTTVTDLSGAGNTGTLHGATLASAPVIFDGATVYVSMPVVVNNSDFTALVVASDYGNFDNRWMWNEADNSLNGGLSLGIIGSGNTYVLDTTSSLGTSFGNPNSVVAPYYSRDYHCYMLQRANNAVTFKVLDQNFGGTKNTGVITVANQRASLGARMSGATPTFFWTGRMAYVLIYTRALPQADLALAYSAMQTVLAAESVFIPDIAPQIYTRRTWQRQGVVFDQTNGGSQSIGEPTIIHEAGAQILSGTVFKMWFTGGTCDIYYGESVDGYTWTQQTAAVVTGHCRSFVTKQGSTYYLYGNNGGSGGIDLYTSSDGLTWTLNTSNVITRGGAGTWDSTNVFNSTVMKEGSTWYMIYEGSGTATPGFGCGGATSTDGITWTKATANPLSGYYKDCGAGQFYHINGEWYLWGHGTPPTGVTGTSVLYRWQSSSFNSRWNRSTVDPILSAGPSNESDQIADPSLIEVAGRAYMYYSAQDGGNRFRMKLAIANMSLSTLVLSSEGATTNAP